MANLLAGDLGGTKVFFHCFDSESGAMLAQARYECANFASFTQIIQTFTQDFALSSIQAATFGLPAPIDSRQVKLTNLPWIVDVDEIEQVCLIPQVNIINDFYASALGIDALTPDDLLCIQAGQKDLKGNRLIIGAGTGLGVSPIVNCHGEFIPMPSEGGHTDFAPLNREQRDLMDWCQHKWQHVSYERILSGSGLEVLYHYFSIEARRASGSSKYHHSAEDIHRLALEGEDIALKALNTFTEIYAAFISNVALIWGAKAGVYIAGGIAPKIQGWIQSSRFMESYLNKGRMRRVVEGFPIYLVLNEQVGLLGAKQHVSKHFKAQ